MNTTLTLLSTHEASTIAVSLLENPTTQAKYVEAYEYSLGSTLIVNYYDLIHEIEAKF